MPVAALVIAAVLAVQPATTLFHLNDKRISEASGIAVATREREVWFTHNDSGDLARFFAVGPTGRTLATYDVDGAHNVDWEDMAAAPDADRVPTLWFGDIGDNDAKRKTIEVYAVPEPHVATGTLHVRGTRYTFGYPDGPHNAESLLVDPRTARIFVASKTFTGETEVFVAPAHPSPDGLNALALLATLHWSAPHDVSSLSGLAEQLATTGGAFSPDGRTLALRTYTDAYLFPVTGTGLAAVKAALAKPPRRLTLPKEQQGEGICFSRDGKSLLLSSEHVGSAVDEVALPAATSAVTSAATPGALGTSASGPAVSPATSPGAVAVPVHTDRPSHVPVVAGGVLAVAAAGTGLLLVRRRRGGPARSSR